MKTFPNKIKFFQSGLIGELKSIEDKDNKGIKLSSPLGAYEYLDDGKRRVGKVTGEKYAKPNIGSTIKFSLEQLIKLDSQMILEVYEPNM